MNNDLNKPKQLNGFAKIIQVDTNGTPIKPVENVVVKKEKEKINKSDLIIVICYIVIILLLLAILGVYICTYVMPRIK